MFSERSNETLPYKLTLNFEIFNFLQAFTQKVLQDIKKSFEYVSWCMKIYRILPDTLQNSATVSALFMVLYKEWHHFTLITFRRELSRAFCKSFRSLRKVFSILLGKKKQYFVLGTKSFALYCLFQRKLRKNLKRNIMSGSLHFPKHDSIDPFPSN